MKYVFYHIIMAVLKIQLLIGQKDLSKTIFFFVACHLYKDIFKTRSLYSKIFKTIKNKKILKYIKR